MKKIILNSFVAAAVLFVASCKPEIDTTAGTTAGSANFSKYIAVGNSLTAGFADGGLYLEGQKVAYPNLIAEKMASVGGGSFTSPFFTDAQSDGSGYITLTALVNGTPTLGRNSGNAWRNSSSTLLTKYTTEIQNLGIPGMSVALATVPAYSALNPYFERVLADASVGTTSYAAFIGGRSHTFFSLWLGNNDVLGYATNGGVVTGATNNLTDKTAFAAAYSSLLTVLTASGQKGIVATIPDVTTIPYFHTVTTAALKAGAAAINPALTNIYIQTASGSRAATNQDLFRLDFSAATQFAQGIGLTPTNPIASSWVLDSEEVARVKDYVNSYNASIKSLAASKDLAVADTYTYMNRLSIPGGLPIQGINLTSAFISGGAFSLDGIHLTPRGNAVIANFFIDAINGKYGSAIPTIDITKYRAVKFPN
ncbi:SGNH/GDSL hydrolase family protein [Pedobacter sp. AW1-32]|uniref:SGNH/GDSL hydrolase family protein n=1 Tax=Pedobacter sp. AW1-32 TaxID=3383026 RepID=UPI003FEEB80B